MATESPKVRVQVHGRGEGMLCHNKAELTSQPSLSRPSQVLSVLAQAIASSGYPHASEEDSQILSPVVSVQGSLMGPWTRYTEDTSLPGQLLHCS